MVVTVVGAAGGDVGGAAGGDVGGTGRSDGTGTVVGATMVVTGTEPTGSGWVVGTMNTGTGEFGRSGAGAGRTNTYRTPVTTKTAANTHVERRGVGVFTSHPRA